MKSMQLLIEEKYRLKIHEMKETTGGWSADAYILQTDQGIYFAKAYDKHRPSIQPWIARMKQYIPVQLWLYENTSMRDWMIVPLPTKEGDYKAENMDGIFMLFPMLHGTTIGSADLNTEQIDQLAVIVAQLHSCASQWPVEAKTIEEDYALPFLSSFSTIVKMKEKPAELRDILDPFAEVFHKGIHMLQKLSVHLQADQPQHVLCHTDIHGWNLMWTDRLILIDWEGLRLAPAEADLFAFSEGFIYEDIRSDWMPRYQQIRKDYKINDDAMAFYRIRRRMEDIAEFVLSIMQDELSAEERALSFQDLKEECMSLYEML